MPAQVPCSVATGMGDTAALFVKNKAEHIVVQIINKCATIHRRFLVDYLLISFTNQLLFAQWIIAICTWTALSRVEALHEPPSMSDILMEHFKWLLPLLFLLSLYEHFLMRVIRSYAQFAAKMSLILPYIILLISAWILLINHDYKLIVPRGCSSDEAKNSTIFDVAIFNTNQTLTSCIIKLFPAVPRCDTSSIRFFSYKRSVELTVKATTFLDVADKWSLCLFGVVGALIQITLDIFDHILVQDLELWSQARIIRFGYFFIFCCVTISPVIQSIFYYCF